MHGPRQVMLRRLAVLICLLATHPAAGVAQACATGTISEITFDRQKPFLPEATSEEATLGWVFRTMNSVHVTTKERTVRWELLFEEGDCLDPTLLEESERNLRTLPYMAEARVRSDQLADGTQRVSVTTLDGWALTAGVVIEVEDGFKITGFSASVKNLLGTGTSVGYFNNTFRERERIGGLVRQPNLLGTRIDATFHGGILVQAGTSRRASSVPSPARSAETRSARSRTNATITSRIPSSPPWASARRLFVSRRSNTRLRTSAGSGTKRGCDS